MNELVAAFAILAFIVAAGALLFAEVANDEARSLGRDLAEEIKRNVRLEKRLTELEQRFGAQAPRRRGQDLPTVSIPPSDIESTVARLEAARARKGGKR